ncbi:unnamed protein product [Paramecium pentaurelia]|uniref:ABC1 atypical kinase-like domain-containing protein n=1 Tax=Paramecium pentaurelia TaxID=43138 RepID=A0A8S1SGV8_9CILI|nr:unnamed protein product [Paramecium pentaurelia]
MQKILKYPFTNLNKSQPFFTKTKIGLTFGVGFSYILYRQGRERYQQMHFSSMYNQIPDTEALTQEYFGEKNNKQLSLFQRMIQNLRRKIRFMHLLLKFLPLAITLPFSLIFKSYLFPYWLKYLVYTLQSAGPLWIKLGQWASHRGDIFGEEIIKALESLRDDTPPHSLDKTYKQFEQAFNKKIKDVFDEFEEKPIASASIAQVHKAKLNGEYVAIKVRHPDIIDNLVMDIRILYKIANFFSETLKIKQLGMPVTFEEFQKTLVNQTDLRFEGRNLKVFCEKFKNNPHVVFPKPIEEYISADILTETYEDAIPLTQFLKQERTEEHLALANLGLKAFYKMLIYDNFIHADCHAGNIMIRIKDFPVPKTFNEKIQQKLWNLQDTVYEIVDDIIEKGLTKIAEYQTQQTMDQGNMLKLKQEKKSDERLFHKFLRGQGQTRKDVQIIFLDPGMITILNKSDRASFIKLVMFVTLRKPYECGKLMLQLAQYNQRQIEQKVQDKFMKEMQDLFTNVCKVPLAQMNIGQVLRSMLEILRANGMSIEGHFAALLTNMIVLEGLAKALDPDLNIVAKAASFIIHIRTIDKTIDEIIQQAL